MLNSASSLHWINNEGRIGRNSHWIYNVKNIFCHLERKINIDILENAILLSSRTFRSKVTVFCGDTNHDKAQKKSILTTRCGMGTLITSK